MQNTVGLYVCLKQRRDKVGGSASCALPAQVYLMEGSPGMASKSTGSEMFIARPTFFNPSSTV